MEISGFKQRGRSRVAGALAVAALIAATAGTPGLAQDAMPEQAAPPAAAPAPAPAESGGDRIGRLEQQIGELQSMVAALATLVKSKPDATLPQESGAPADAGSVDSGLSARVDALETRLGALTGQIELLTQQMGAMDTRGGGGAPPAEAAPPPQDEAPQDVAPQDEAPMPMEPPGRQGDASPEPEAQFASAGPTAPQRLSALPAGADAATLYTQGYGDLLRRDYGSAEIAFRQIVANFPNDRLASKAEYWLGETYFVRGQFKDAADAFLKSYNAHKTGEKAPDSLVKLGMALGELGQKDAACATLGEFKQSFPTADEVLRDQARSERSKLGC